MTVAEMKKEFEIYFAWLKAKGKRDGYRLNKADEWKSFKNLLIGERAIYNVRPVRGQNGIE